MTSPAANTFFRSTQLVFILLACSSVPLLSAAPQGGSTESLGGRSATGSIVVYVRNAAGEPLTTPALVRLYSSEGMPLGELSVVNGRQATFRNVQLGSYSVEVEASGYEKTHGEVQLPMSGEAIIQMYLRPESKSEAGVLSDPGTPVLAPKAKKEVDAGLEALRNKDLDKARKHLEKAREMAPSHPEVLYLLGTLYSQMNDLPHAEELLAKTIQMYPQYAPAQAALGIVLSNEARYEAAVQPLVNGLERNESWEARWALARCFYHQQKYELALAESRRALQDSNGAAPEIALVVAASLSATGQYEASATVLRQFLREHSQLPGAVRARRWLAHLEETGRIHSD